MRKMRFTRKHVKTRENAHKLRTRAALLGLCWLLWASSASVGLRWASGESLGSSGGPLGGLLGALWTFLGPRWASVGPLGGSRGGSGGLKTRKNTCKLHTETPETRKNTYKLHTWTSASLHAASNTHTNT